MKKRLQCLSIALALIGSLAVAKAQILTVPNQTSGGQFQLSLNGNTGNYYTVEFSTNLINWSPLLITNPPNSQPLNLHFSTVNKAGFYQAFESGVAIGQSDFSFGASVIYVNVTNGTAVIPITRTSGLSSNVCVNYSTSDGTAVGGCDYESESGMLCFAAGVTSNSFSIPVSLGCNTDQSATVNLQVSDPNGTNVLNAVLVIQRPPPILTVNPTSLTLDVPGNCPQSITIGNAGPQGSVLNYTVADDGAFAGYLNLNGGGSFASGSLQAGQTAQVTFTVLDQFAFNWIGGTLTTAADIYTPGAANYAKYPVSVTISPDDTKPQTEVLGTWHGTWSGTSMTGTIPEAGPDNYETPVGGTWVLTIQSVDPVHNTASGTIVWQGTDAYWTYTDNEGDDGNYFTDVSSSPLPVNQTITFPSDATMNYDGSQSVYLSYLGCGQFLLSFGYYVANIDGFSYGVYWQGILDVNTKSLTNAIAGNSEWGSQILSLESDGDGSYPIQLEDGESWGPLTGSQQSP